ncbi:MAG: DUF1573 domain-containing protein [Aureliella sp.]
MRFFALAGFALAVCAAALPAAAQSTTDKMIPQAQRAHDFGTVARAAKTEHRFEIVNPFQQPMHLRSISASCGCTTPIIETEWIQPGQVGTVLARFNTGTFSGDRKASLNLVIDQPSFVQLQLNVKGYIRSDVVFNPGELNFGSVPEGESKEVEANLEYAGRSDWQITRISSNADFVSADFIETARENGRVSYKIKANIGPHADSGTQAVQLVLHTNDRRLKTVPLNCIAQIEAPLSVSPSNVNLGQTRPGQPIERRLLIKGNEPFQIVDVTVPEMEVLFEPTTEAKKIQFLNVTLIPDSSRNPGEIETKMTIKTDMGGEREVTLDLSYEVPELSDEELEEPSQLSDRDSSRGRKLISTE